MQKSNPSTLPAYLALIAGVFIIGTSAILVKFANLPGLVSGFYRVGIATAVLLPIWLYKNRDEGIPSWHNLKFILLGGILFGTDVAFWNTSILLTTAAKSTLLANNSPIWVGLGAAFLFKEKLSPKYWSGLALALLGMATIVGVDSWRTSEFNIGDMMAIGTSFLYAGVMLSTQKARTRVDTLTFSALYTATAALTLLPVALLTGQEMSGFSSQSWWSLLALGLGPQVVGWMLINYALGHLRASHVSVSLLGQPVVTAILGFFILGEMLTVNQMLGGMLVLGGIYLVNQKSALKRKQA
ncbi:MAG: EamA family transporter [Anaerolineae bacterium]|jgi:drug/metabolite transporter (DMT)-like permease|nr:EamA family transporter [Anaerolineae bacterium]MBT7069990.1 EamA family transporter [Anaerolineae bacterium]MBT7325690.1 EamA family transporter [Anaerolineae bacterium]